MQTERRLARDVPREIEVEKSSGNEGKRRHHDDLGGRKAARREGHDQPEIEAIREHEGCTGGGERSELRTV
jgi:hypothetical protein